MGFDNIMIINKVGSGKIKIIHKAVVSILLFLAVFFICSCSSEKSYLEGKLEEENATLAYLKTIPKEIGEMEFTASNELDVFLKARDDYYDGNYKDSLLATLKALYYYVPSSYETEVLYLLGKVMPYIVKENPFYIEECYNHIKEQFELLEIPSEDFTIKNFYSFIGIEERKDGSLRYNNAPLIRILEEDSSALIPKDDLYYEIRKNDFQTVRDANDRQRFMLNINRLSFFSDLYRTSDKQAILLDNNSYFPKELPFTLDAEQRERYSSLVSKIRERVELITPEISERAYVIGDRVRIRDRIRTSSMDDTITLHHLNDYDSVEVLRKFEVKLRGRDNPEAWVLVKYNSVYGDIVGFSLARYFRNIDGSDYNIKLPVDDIEETEEGVDEDNVSEVVVYDYSVDVEVYQKFTDALENYRNHNYIEAADGFAFVLNQDITNYFTDKSSYLLWRVNNSIASLITSQSDPYYQYAKKYPNYFVYNQKDEALASSILLYSYLINTIPDSKLKFKMSGEVDMM